MYVVVVVRERCRQHDDNGREETDGQLRASPKRHVVVVDVCINGIVVYALHEQRQEMRLNKYISRLGMEEYTNQVEIVQDRGDKRTPERRNGDSFIVGIGLHIAEGASVEECARTEEHNEDLCDQQSDLLDHVVQTRYLHVVRAIRLRDKVRTDPEIAQ